MRHKLLRIFVVMFVVTTLSMGVVALAKKPPRPGPGPGPTCPAPDRGCICYALYAPVVCGPDNCEYSNDCWASCAGWNPSTDCTSVGGPIEF